jgi:hypothetical protein
MAAQCDIQVSIIFLTRTRKSLWWLPFVQQTSSHTTMRECDRGNIIARTGCIFAYDGDTRDIAINYAVLGIDMIMSYVVFLAWPDQRKKRTPAALSLLFVIVLQLVICWWVACSGISVVWCAVCGWMLHEKRQPPPFELEGLRKWAASTVHVLIIPLNIAVIVYYALVANILTTVAHFCAMVLGVLLSKSSSMPLQELQQNLEGGLAAATNSTPLVDSTTMSRSNDANMD